MKFRAGIFVLAAAISDREGLRFDYDAAVSSGANLLLKPGDIVVVP